MGEIKRAIGLGLNNAIIIGNYANFLQDIRKDYDLAEAYYKRAIELDPKDVVVLVNYTLFLKNVRRNYDKVEEYYKSVLKLDPKSFNYIESYALFLSDIRKDYDKAEIFYNKVIEFDPENADFVGNYAHHLIISKQDFKEAETLIDRAFELADKKKLDILSELWFYRYAHYDKWLNKGEKELERLISEGAKSIGWNFQSHIEIAKTNHHPNINNLERFAKLFTDPTYTPK